jgi:hypothetical protein
VALQDGADVMIVDPPRKGLEKEVLDALCDRKGGAARSVGGRAPCLLCLRRARRMFAHIHSCFLEALGPVVSHGAALGVGWWHCRLSAWST